MMFSTQKTQASRYSCFMSGASKVYRRCASALLVIDNIEVLLEAVLLRRGYGEKARIKALSVAEVAKFVKRQASRVPGGTYIILNACSLCF